MNLNHTQRMSLVALTTHHGWSIFLDMLEEECQKATAELLKVDPSNSSAVVAAHNTARAYNQFSTRMQKAVLTECSEALAEAESAKVKVEESMTGIPGLTDAVSFPE